MIPYDMILCMFWLLAGDQDGKTPEFSTSVEGVSLRVRAIECFVNGPFVVDVTLVNTNPEALRVELKSAISFRILNSAPIAAQRYLARRDADDKVSKIHIVARTKDGRPLPEGSDSKREEPIPALPGPSTVTHRSYLHDRWEVRRAITAVEFELSTRIEKSGGTGGLLAATGRFWVIPKEFSSDVRRKVAVDLLKRLDESHSPEAAQDVSQRVLGTFYTELVPVATRLLRYSEVPALELLDHIYLSCAKLDDAFRIISDELQKPDLPITLKCFEYWRDAAFFRSWIAKLEEELRKPPPEPPATVKDSSGKFLFNSRVWLREWQEKELRTYKAIDKARGGIDSCPSAAQRQALLSVPNPFASAVAGVYFPDSVSPPTLDAIALKLTNRLCPPNEQEWKSMVEKLNDARYVVRKDGMQEVVQFGERAIPRLDELSKTTRDANLIAIIAELRRTIEKSPVAPPDEWVLVECVNQRNAVSERLLANLSKIEHSPTLASRASKILAQWREHDKRTRETKDKK